MRVCKKSDVYFIGREDFREAMVMCAFRRDINWLEEGMSILSWKYNKVATVKRADKNIVYKHLRGWDGNARSRAAGHRSITTGDIVCSNGEPWLVTGGGWVRVPDIIWKRVIKTGE